MIKVSKYRNRKTLVDGIQFDSQKEANRYQELILMERAGLIRSIELQPRYESIGEWAQDRLLSSGLSV